MGKSVIVAGIGSRKGVSAQEVLDALDAALSAHGLGREALTALATTDFKRDETGIFDAARALGLEVAVVKAPPHRASAPLGHQSDDMGSTPMTPSPLWGGVRGGGTRVSLPTQSIHAQPVDVSSPPPLTPPHKGEGDVGVAPYLTHSPLSQKHAGVGSVSEAAALGAAGEGARLLGPRIATGRVTCALATSEPST